MVLGHDGWHSSLARGFQPPATQLLPVTTVRRRARRLAEQRSAAEVDPELEAWTSLGIPLGRSATAETELVLDPRTGRTAVLKRSFGNLGLMGDADTILLAEAHVLQLMDHHRIPRYLRHGIRDQQVILVMERKAGVDLHTLLQVRRQQLRPVRFPAALRLLTEVQEALRHIAERSGGQEHRDLSPGNILFDPSRGAAVLDLALVHQPWPHPVADWHDRSARSRVWTPPDRDLGPDQRGCDVYSLAKLTYALLTLRQPPLHLTRDEAWSSLPPPLADVVARACDLDHGRRPAVADLIAAVAHLVDADHGPLPVAPAATAHRDRI